MNPTANLRNVGQSLWLDHVTRALVTRGTLQRYTRDFSVTGLTSNPTIFDQAIENSDEYDDSIRSAPADQTSESLFFNLAIEDLALTADLFASMHQTTNGVDGCGLIEIIPELGHHPGATLRAAQEFYERARHPNLFIKISGMSERIPAVAEAICTGVSGKGSAR